MDNFPFTLSINGSKTSFVTNRRGFRSALSDALIELRVDIAKHRPVVKFDLTKSEEPLLAPFRFESCTDIFDKQIREYWRQRDAVERLINAGKRRGPSLDGVAGEFPPSFQ